MSALTPPTPPQSPAERSPLQAVADATARHYKEYFGRGPTRCRAHFAGKDAIVCVLESTMSLAEQHLVAHGDAERMRDGRLAAQQSVQGILRATVEELCGRPIRYAVSGIDVRADVVTELFAFHEDAAD
ncbi:Na-translocating system protein MpsC family protein [Patulibacter sp. SYSU D01012]|uniref:Na-translocating system protein MpsC family protein n=1 Tax=Patulibacter sp. SYSU D01012 TaxID=2817381 RepID=UPI001B317465|nr:Na-translocating system protein MpsC family protein [Patulibacter sp. SYSU D01012]